MPKQRITKEMVVDAAFEIARAGGMEQVLVKNIAEKLGCSVQPIYSYCSNMEGLRRDVEQKVRCFVKAYVAEHVDQDDLFRGIGKAYIQLAKEEPPLFRIFILCQRNGVSSLDDLYRSEANSQVAVAIAERLGISLSQAKQLHLHMLIYTMGLGAIFSMTTPGISAEEIFAQQEMAYEVFLKQALNRENSDESAKSNIAI